MAGLTSVRKRLLFLLLKCAWEVDDELINKCSLLLGIPSHYLFNLIELARRRTESAQLQQEQINVKLHSLWIRLRVLELRRETCLLKSEKDYIQHSLERARTRYLRLLERRKTKRSVVSNECIAEILGVPKGSVDSGLYYLRKSIEKGNTLADYRKLG